MYENFELYNRTKFVFCWISAGFAGVTLRSGVETGVVRVEVVASDDVGREVGTVTRSEHVGVEDATDNVGAIVTV